MKIVLCGHWDTVAGASLFAAPTSAAPSPSHEEALAACARGVSQTVPEVEIECLPYGPGSAFITACTAAVGGEYAFSVPFDCEDAYELGAQVRERALLGRRSVIEAGHVPSIHLWRSFAAGVTGRYRGQFDVRTGDSDLRTELVKGLAQCREDLGDYAPVFAATTMRPFTGMASMLAVNPDLSVRSDISMAVASQWAAAIDEADTTARSALPLLSGVHPRVTTLPGSGAGGGIGAIVAAMGGQIRDAGEYLAEVTGVTRRLEEAQLCVIFEPYLHGPLLAESYLPTLTSACAEHALPVVAIGVDSSLSRHEIAQWGLHAVMLGVDSVEALENLGCRVAHTWLRRLSRSV